MKVGDLVRAGYLGGPLLYRGIIIEINQHVAWVLYDKQELFFILEEDNIELIDENRRFSDDF